MRNPIRKILGFSLPAAMLLSAHVQAAPSKPERKPNIVIFLIDDQ